MNRFLIALLLAQVTIIVSKNCFENWSRCTPETAFATGILWKSCPEYCQKCRGRADGECVQVYNRECSGGYQCQCKGGSYPKSTDAVDKATCKLGL
ncbi:hypothetical protein OESDEN_05743 [Oesophagostomum dentatum]|uniref:Uncharacterized protein n=1 Tax=Oesophagostomum dentatum TaxID=61180 RepID=A0A0B1TAN9_OESDE|nr:hypothetical protein OESDEN_05743 [Oesophagostomum dentatum]